MKTKLFYLIILCIALTSCNSKPKKRENSTPDIPNEELSTPYSPDSKFYMNELIDMASLSLSEINEKVISRGYKLDEEVEPIDSNYTLFKKSYNFEIDRTISIDCHSSNETKRLLKYYDINNNFSKSQSFHFNQTIRNKRESLVISDYFLKQYGLKKDQNLLNKVMQVNVFNSRNKVYSKNNMVIIISSFDLPQISNPNDPKSSRAKSREYLYSISIHVFS
jgi:hypothetical protein